MTKILMIVSFPLLLLLVHHRSQLFQDYIAILKAKLRNVDNYSCSSGGCRVPP